MAQKYRFTRIFLSFLILLLFTHCSAKHEGVIREDQNEILKKRASEYWQHIVNGRVDRAYQYEMPQFSEKVTFLEYLNRFKLMIYTEAAVLNTEIKGEEGKVAVRMTYKWTIKELKRMKTLTETKEENWIRVKGNWYHIPEGFEYEKTS